MNNNDGCQSSGNDQGKVIVPKIREIHPSWGKFKSLSGEGEILTVHIYSFPSTVKLFVL